MIYEQKFWQKVEKTTDCWLWKGSKNKEGYGQFYAKGLNTRRAHRVAYMITNNFLPDNMVIDHLCRNTSCVRPDHLEAVSDRENIMRGLGCFALNKRKTHCKHGHEFTEENTLLDKKNNRVCRVCRRRINKEGKTRWLKKQSEKAR